MSDSPIYPHTVRDGHRLRLACNSCGKSVSTPFEPAIDFIVRAFIQCPECIKAAQREALAIDHDEDEGDPA